MKEDIKNVLLMGLGAISLTGEKASEIKKELLEKGYLVKRTYTDEEYYYFYEMPRYGKNPQGIKDVMGKDHKGVMVKTHKGL